MIGIAYSKLALPTTYFRRLEERQCGGRPNCAISLEDFEWESLKRAEASVKEEQRESEQANGASVGDGFQFSCLIVERR